MTNEIQYAIARDGRIMAVFTDRIDLIGYGNTDSEAREDLMHNYMRRLGDVPPVTTVKEPTMVHTARFTGDPALCQMVGQSIHSPRAAEEELVSIYKKWQHEHR